MPMPISIDDLRRHAVARSLFRPTTLPKALARLGFVQADPIRAPARAQDLTLRHRVVGYRAGDLERRYARLDIEEDFFVNYGFLPRAIQRLMHPRTARTEWLPARWQQARAVLDFVRERGTVHPRVVDAHFGHGKTTNWFGGSSNASTQLLDGMHYRGLLRVARREGGVRLYAPADAALARPQPGDPAAALDILAGVLLQKYAPLPARSLAGLVMHLRLAVPQWADGRSGAFKRVRAQAGSVCIDGQTWLWPATERPSSARHAPGPTVRLLAPFDPLVWDRHRFELLWGWAYRFEAYTPAPQRKLGYYAMPLLWRDRVIGWANAAVTAGRLQVRTDYVAGRAPPEAGFSAALDDEIERLRAFLQADR